MRMNPPTKVVFWITVILAALGLVGAVISVPILSTLAIWLVLLACVVLAASLFVKGR